MQIRENRIKHKLARGESVYVVMGITDPDDIDAFGPVGADGVWLEGEHGGVDFADLGNLTRACDIWGMTSIVRINRNDEALIYRVLDRGAQAIVVPHVDTQEEAINVVRGGKFAPIGRRGMFTSRQGLGVDNYYALANDETALIALIEDVVAIGNIDSILTVDHVDVFMVAPTDLAQSMGHRGNVKHPEVQKTIEQAVERIVRAGRVAGTLGTLENVAKYSSLGVRFFAAPVMPWIQAGATELIRRGNAAKNNRSS